MTNNETKGEPRPEMNGEEREAASGERRADAIPASPRAALQALVERAERTLRERGDYLTAGAKLAVRDMIGQAESALADEARVPFARNREFYAPRDDEAIRFATRRYTMAPTYLAGGKVYGEYGLEPALEWLEEQDLLAGGPERLAERAARAIREAEKLLAAARIGGAVGEYDAEVAERLRDAIGRVRLALGGGAGGKGDIDALDSPANADGVDIETLARAAVRCLDRTRELRFSRVLRSDVEPASSLYLAPEALEALREKVRTDPLIRGQYEQLERIADRHDLASVERAVALFLKEEPDYGEINRHFYVWSSTDKIVNFRAPEGAVRASLSFVLPAEENEADGPGHVWIDNLEILSAQGGSLDIRNGGFDEGGDAPAHWRPEALRGRPQLRWEAEYPFCGGGDRRAAEESANPSSQADFAYSRESSARRSLYMCNPTGEDEGAWTYDSDFAIEGGAGYTLTFNAKLDGKLKRGLKTMIVFKDADGQVLDVFESWFNRKSSSPNGGFLLTLQADAIQYAMTGDRTYALKAKHELLFALNDFCQGAEHWMATNLRPQGSDAYGAVQGGRLLCGAAVAYSMIKDAGAFSPEEKASLYARVDYLLRYMLDLRDRTELTPEDAQRGCSNWQTDMCAGTAYMMLALDDFPNRKAWLYNAYAVLKAQLTLGINPDGSWPESIRYHHAALERFAGVARVFALHLGENWFETTRLAGMFRYGIDMQTPGYELFGGRIGTPPFGDHALGGGAEFGLYGIYMEEVAKVDTELAERMDRTWRAAGRPFKRYWGESVALDNLLGRGDGDGSVLVPAPALTSTKAYPDAGIYVFRSRAGGGGRDGYFALMASPKPIGHGHLDQGSFILYHNAVPLVVDSGIEGYFDSSTSWHICSYSHACLQFRTRRDRIERSGGGAINLSAGTYSLERGWVDVPRTSRVLACTLGEETDSIAVEIANPEGAGRHVRQVIYIKETGLCVIRDTVRDFEGDVLFSLPVAALRSVVVRGSRVLSECGYGIDLETAFVGELRDLRLEKGRSTKLMEDGPAGYSLLDYIRATADARHGFLTLLHPMERGAEPLRYAWKDEKTLVVTAGERTVEIAMLADGRMEVVQC